MRNAGVLKILPDPRGGPVFRVYRRHPASRSSRIKRCQGEWNKVAGKCKGNTLWHAVIRIFLFSLQEDGSPLQLRLLAARIPDIRKIF